MPDEIPIVAKIIIGAVLAGVLLVVILVPMSFSALEYYEVSAAEEIRCIFEDYQNLLVVNIRGLSVKS